MVVFHPAKQTESATLSLLPSGAAGFGPSGVGESPYLELQGSTINRLNSNVVNGPAVNLGPGICAQYGNARQWLPAVKKQGVTCVFNKEHSKDANTACRRHREVIRPIPLSRIWYLTIDTPATPKSGGAIAESHRFALYVRTNSWYVPQAYLC